MEGAVDNVLDMELRCAWLKRLSMPSMRLKLSMNEPNEGKTDDQRSKRRNPLAMASILFLETNKEISRRPQQCGGWCQPGTKHMWDPPHAKP